MEPVPSSHPPSEAVASEVAARERMMSCMQALIRDLGQANSHLEHELARRRRLARAVSRELPSTAGGREFESLMIASGSLGLLSLPVAANGKPDPAESNSVLAPMTRRFADTGRVFVNHLRPVPGWEPLAGLIRRSDPATAARLARLAGDLVALRLAQTMFRSLPHEVVRDSLDEAGVMVTDEAGLVRLVNHRLLTLTDLKFEELHGRSWWRALIPEEDWPAIRRMPGFPNPAGSRNHDIWIKGGQGRTFPVKMYAGAVQRGGRRVGSVTLIVAEGTEQHQQMEDLSKRERTYRRVFEEDVTGQYTCTPDGKLLTCNAAFARIFGFSSVEEALGCNLRQLHLSGAAADQFLDELTRRRRLVYYESTMRRVDGREIHVIRNVSGEFDAEGRLRSIVGFVFDNTEHRRLEERVRQSQKMETVGRLAGGIAHDFNNLLLAIQGYASLLAEHVMENPEASDALGHIQRSADRAATLTRQLLAFSRRQVLQPRAVNLNEIVVAMLPLLQRLLGESVEVVPQLAPDLGLVRADRAQLEDVLVNLAANARDAMPGGGRLQLSSRNVELRDTWFAFHDGPQPGDYVELAVQDNGSGMSEEVKAHLFEPFFTTKEQGKGTGLGLSTVYGIIKQSGGEVQAYSTLGQGTTIKILLPRMAGAPTDALKPPAPGAPATSFSILVVEDEPAVRSLVRRILEREGHAVMDASHPNEALALVGEARSRVDLLVTDLVLPGMSGRELWERLQTDSRELPVIYMSGYTEDAVIKHGVRGSKVNFLQKPFKPDELIAKVREVLRAG